MNELLVKTLKTLYENAMKMSGDKGITTQCSDYYLGRALAYMDAINMFTDSKYLHWVAKTFGVEDN